MILLLKWWREAAIVLLALGLIAYCQGRDRAKVREGIAQERYRIADSTLAVLKVAQRKIDSVFVRDTLRFTRWRDSVTIRHDTVLAHLTDTIRVKELIQVQDSAIATCTNLLSSCSARVLNLQDQLTQERAKVAAIPLATPRSCTSTGAVSGLVGLGLGFLGGRLAK
ncbi:MAG: hypothetical protein ACR652_24650 [Methylocystis sp.]|uniref:hypothetical protein n=1 Tax=Methylocystis sp. TaxID=1911079 RepID=UPI003DA33109